MNYAISSFLLLFFMFAPLMVGAFMGHIQIIYGGSVWLAMMIFWCISYSEHIKGGKNGP